MDDLGFVDRVATFVVRHPIRATGAVDGLRSSWHIGSLWAGSCFTTRAIMRRYASTVAGDGPPHRSLAAASNGVAPRPGPGKTWASISSKARVQAVTLSEPGSSLWLMTASSRRISDVFARS
jgi:hypothetical protein